ncbi:YhcN/YlaJ family sporulation lipoprotein [Domibacillus enclensis]|uniref:Lipoprotein n=1 Tax=Domibacillus enclensis TaxID=1017273 RepID=A0A1N6NU19_9BACI|nr:YhcN/YlaJ family sporulation lipoprotein [Domibacillus enclensis]OXS80144.1 hypothetical protein B1B05_01295 [Domibacillus enclensis]SIP95527.1 hypothetical protein SAMN05443094_101272 [Domibacillus enclensis]
MPKFFIYVAAFMTTFLLVACMNNRDNTQQDNLAQNVTYDEQDQSDTATPDIGEEAANHITDLEEVKSATVLMTGQTAYTAINLTNKTKFYLVFLNDKPCLKPRFF